MLWKDPIKRWKGKDERISWYEIWVVQTREFGFQSDHERPSSIQTSERNGYLFDSIWASARLESKLCINVYQCIGNIWFLIQHEYEKDNIFLHCTIRFFMVFHPIQILPVVEQLSLIVETNHALQIVLQRHFNFGIPRLKKIRHLHRILRLALPVNLVITGFNINWHTKYKTI